MKKCKFAVLKYLLKFTKTLDKENKRIKMKFERKKGGGWTSERIKMKIERRKGEDETVNELKWKLKERKCKRKLSMETFGRKMNKRKLRKMNEVKREGEINK